MSAISSYELELMYNDSHSVVVSLNSDHTVSYMGTIDFTPENAISARKSGYYLFMERQDKRTYSHFKVFNCKTGKTSNRRLITKYLKEGNQNDY